MNPENNEPRHIAGAGGRVSGAVAAEATVAHPLDLPQQGVVAVLASNDLYVVPNPMFCTGLTAKRQRCQFLAWPRDCGEWAYIVGRAGILYAIDAGPGWLPEARVQRCDVHTDAPAFCAPEIELFHPQLHASLVVPLTDEWVRL